MSETISTTTLAAGAATELAAVDNTRVHLRIQNTSANSTLYVNEASGLAVNTPGNEALHPGDVLIREGIQAGAAMYVTTHSTGHPAPITVKVRAIHPQGV